MRQQSGDGRYWGEIVRIVGGTLPSQGAKWEDAQNMAWKSKTWFGGGGQEESLLGGRTQTRMLPRRGAVTWHECPCRTRTRTARPFLGWPQ